MYPRSQVSVYRTVRPLVYINIDEYANEIIFKYTQYICKNVKWYHWCKNYVQP